MDWQSPTPERPARRRRLFKRALLSPLAAFWLAGLFSGLFLFGALIVWFFHDFPDLEALAAPPSSYRVTLLYADGTEMIRLGDPPKAITFLPAFLPRSVEAALGIPPGGSAALPLARSLVTARGPIRRPLQVALLSVVLDYRLSPRSQLERLLYHADFGAGVIGIDNAARRFFGKPADRLTPPEAATLAGLLVHPNAQRAVRITYGAFIDWVLKRLPELAQRSDGRLVVLTTLDRGLQSLAESEAGNTAATLVALSPEGAVRAMLPGTVDGAHPPGSAFNLFADLAALANDSIALDFSGASLPEAPAIDRRTAVAMARRLGVASPLDEDPSHPLGNATLLELSGALATVLHGGHRVTPFGVLEVRDQDGQLLYFAHRHVSDEVIDPEVAATMNGLLVSMAGAERARLGRPAAALASIGEGECWYLGYTAELVTGVWTAGGESQASDLWHRFVLHAHEGHPSRPLETAATVPETGGWEDLKLPFRLR